MATTNPDNIWTPDSGDDYALTTDLAATADTIQDALTKRANYYVGTTSELAGVAATAPEGAAGYDTTLDKEVRLIGGAWVGATYIAPLEPPIYFTANGTFTKASYPGARAVRVRVVGGGGAAGGAMAPPPGSFSCGAGGGGGGYAESIIPIDSVPTSVAVTVGAGGVGVSGTTGGAGGASSFGTLVVATGGTGGWAKPGNAYSPYAPPGVGGVGTAGDFLVSGSAGSVGAGSDSLGSAGSGGGSVLGGGGQGRASGSGSVSEKGLNGGNYGGGGGGSYANAGGGAQPGGNGAPGIVIVEVLF